MHTHQVSSIFSLSLLFLNLQFDLLAECWTEGIHRSRCAGSLESTLQGRSWRHRWLICMLCRITVGYIPETNIGNMMLSLFYVCSRRVRKRRSSSFRWIDWRDNSRCLGKSCCSRAPEIRGRRRGRRPRGAPHNGIRMCWLLIRHGEALNNPI